MKLSFAALAAALGAMMVTPAEAQAAPHCADREVVLYFEKGEADFNEFSQALLAKVADAARACGVAQVTAQAPEGALAAQRAAAVEDALEDLGVRVLLVDSGGAAATAPVGVLDRRARVRMTLASPAVS
jgi:ABC-type sugar transport system substrate-binding protein